MLYVTVNSLHDLPSRGRDNMEINTKKICLDFHIENRDLDLIPTFFVIRDK